MTSAGETGPLKRNLTPEVAHKRFKKYFVHYSSIILGGSESGKFPGYFPVLDCVSEIGVKKVWYHSTVVSKLPLPL